MASENPGGWLMNALKNHIRKYYEKLAAERKLGAELAASAENAPAWPGEPGGMTVADELSPEELRLVRLREQGYGYDEIAGFLDMKPGAVRVRMSRIKSKAASILGIKQ
jgi:DNA-directed RNA polymerase specialized sigma24 family protein